MCLAQGAQAAGRASRRRPSFLRGPLLPARLLQKGLHLALVVDMLVLVHLALHVRVRVRVHIRVEFGVKLGADSRAWAQQVLGGCWGAQLLTQHHASGAAEGG